MRAVVYHEYGQEPVITEFPDPHCPPDGVVVAVEATGVCRSDWHCWLGHDPVPLPMIPGHELAGTIAAVGDRVTRWQVGDRVTVPFACGCGTCELCRAGDPHVCPHQTQPGCTDLGSFAELVALRNADTNLIGLPDDVEAIEAAALGCRMATSFRGIVAQGRLQAGEWLAVFGCGGVGLSAVMIAKALGAHVVALDTSPAARSAATEHGADVVLDVPAGQASDETAAAVVEATGGGAHVSLDALGSPDAVRSGVLSLRPRGRHLQIGLLLGDAAEPPVPMGRVIAKELEVLGCHGMPAGDYPAMLAMVESGALRLRDLVQQVVGLAEAPAALMALGEPSTRHGIVVVDPRR